jgi:hypothetical protein
MINSINVWAVLVSGVLSMVLGFIWYGPLFGKKWMEICGVDKLDMERRAEMMKGVWKLYITQFLLTLFQVWVLAWYVQTISALSSPVHTAFSMWIAFVMPTVAGSAMWNNDSGKVSWARFLIQTGFQLVLFIMVGFILGMWK